MTGTRRPRLASILIALAMVIASPAPLVAGLASDDDTTVGADDMSAMPDCTGCAAQGSGGMAGPCSAPCTIVSPAVLAASTDPENFEGTTISIFDEHWALGGADAPDPRPPAAARG